MMRASLLVASLLLTSTAHAGALDGFPNRRISFEFKNVSVGDFFRLVADAGGVTAKVDPCAADKKLTLQMRNAPLDVIVRAVADREGFNYRFDGQQLAIGCGDSPPATSPAPTPAASAPTRVTTASPTGGNAELVRLRAENAELRTQLAHVQTELDRQRTDVESEHGTPIPQPANLPARFTGDALMQNITAALREAGMTKAQVTSVDCSEYPCIVYGNGMSAREDTDKLKDAQSFAPYARDRIASFGWISGARYPEPEDGAMQWGLAVTPPDDVTPREQMSKRLAYRTSLMRDASQDSPKK